MKNLRLVFDNINGKRKDITLPMEKWIADWNFECDIVPQNDTVILAVEVDGKSILNDIKAVCKRCVVFEEVAWYFNWDGLYDDFVGAAKENPLLENNSNVFSKWLVENIIQ